MSTSYQDSLFREPVVATMFARARQVRAECEIMAESTAIEKAVTDMMEAVMGETRDFARIDDIAIEIARAAMRMRRRSRVLAGRVPVRRPQPPVVCPQCEFTVRRGTGDYETSRKSPAPPPMPERFNEDAAQSAEAPTPPSPAQPREDLQPHTAPDIEGNAENTPGRTLRTRQTPAPNCQPALAGRKKQIKAARRELVEAAPGGT